MHLPRPIPKRRSQLTSRGRFLRGPLKVLLGIGILGAAISAAVTLAISAVACRRAIYPPPSAEVHELNDFEFARIAEFVSFPSRDGTGVCGWFVPARHHCGATVVLLHGYGNWRAQLLPHADYLHRDGYNVLLIDMRGRGDSGGNMVTLGAHEPLDALGALDYLVTRPDVDPGRIALQGVSLGAAVAILAASRDGRFRAVVAESAFTDILGAVQCSFEHFIHLPATPFANIALYMTEWRVRGRAGDISPINAIRRLKNCPVLIIDDELDQRIPANSGQRLYDAAGGQKELWLVKDSGHTEAFSRYPSDYERRVLDFYARYLSPHPQS